MASLAPVSSASSSLTFIPKGASKKTAIVSDGRKKVHHTYEDGAELVEEFDMQTDNLLVRKWRRPTALGGEGQWVFEIGSAPPPPARLLEDSIVESSSNPVFLRQDTETAFQWRVRNIPYPKSTYQLSIEEADQCIVLRTTNKKYYKKFDVPDMKRAGLKLDNGSLSFDHMNNTLIISYRKPAAIVQKERNDKSERQKMKAEKPARDGDVECAQQ